MSAPTCHQQRAAQSRLDTARTTVTIHLFTLMRLGQTVFSCVMYMLHFCVFNPLCAGDFGEENLGRGGGGHLLFLLVLGQNPHCLTLLPSVSLLEFCTVPSVRDVPLLRGMRTGSPSTRSALALCPSPSGNNGTSVYCDGRGYTTPCPGGVFGNTSGLTSAACSSPCAPGYFCPVGSVNATAMVCGGVDR